MLSEAWELFKDNAGVVVGATLLLGFVQGLFSAMNQVLQLIASQVQQLAGGEIGPELIILVMVMISLAIGLVSMVVNVFLSLGYARILLRIVRRERPDFMLLFSGLPYLVPGLVANLLVGIGAALGCLLLIVPGVILMLGWSFFMFLIVDKGCGPIEALKESWRITDGEKGPLFLWFLVCGLLVAAGIMACCVGVFVSGPLCGIGTALIYVKLQHGSSTA